MYTEPNLRNKILYIYFKSTAYLHRYMKEVTTFLPLGGHHYSKHGVNTLMHFLTLSLLCVVTEYVHILYLKDVTLSFSLT